MSRQLNPSRTIRRRWHQPRRTLLGRGPKFAAFASSWMPSHPHFLIRPFPLRPVGTLLLIFAPSSYWPQTGH